MSEKYGFVSWAWRVFRVDDDTLLENCGMDAVCFLRCLRLGAKLALVGIFNAIYLIPIFYTASDSQSDKFIRMSVANLPAGSERFAAVVVATYVAVFAALYLVAKEYNWYARLRHKFLGQDMPRNYAVYVYGIPEEMQSNYALADFFRLSSFSDPNQKPVLEANIAMDIPKLEAKVAKRKTVIQKLEHAIAEESIKGVVKTHRTFNLQNATDKEKRVTESVESVQAYRKELEELNKQISLEVGRIRNQNDPLRRHLSKQKGGSDLLRGRALTLDYDDCPAAEENEEVTIEFLESKDLPMLDDSQGGADMEYAYPFSDVSETEHTATAGDDDLEMGTIEESKPVDWPAEVETLENVDTRDETTSEVMELKCQDIDDARFANPRSTRSLASSASNSASRLKNRASSSMQRVSGSLHHLKPPPVNVETLTGGVKRARDLSVYGSKKVRDLGISGAQMAADKAKNAAAKAPRLASSLAENAAAIAPILRLKGEGAPREAGFVVFDGLFLTQAALQMLQHPVGKHYLMKVHHTDFPSISHSANLTFNPKLSTRSHKNDGRRCPRAIRHLLEKRWFAVQFTSNWIAFESCCDNDTLSVLVVPRRFHFIFDGSKLVEEKPASTWNGNRKQPGTGAGSGVDGPFASACPERRRFAHNFEMVCRLGGAHFLPATGSVALQETVCIHHHSNLFRFDGFWFDHGRAHEYA